VQSYHIAISCLTGPISIFRARDIQNTFNSRQRWDIARLTTAVAHFWFIAATGCYRVRFRCEGHASVDRCRVRAMWVRTHMNLT